MTIPTIELHGLLAGTDLPIERLSQAACIDDHGRSTISMLDVLAMARLDHAAEILLVEFDDGSNAAFTVRQLVGTDCAALCLHASGGGISLVCSVASEPCTPERNVVALAAMRFATFVGVG